MLKKYTKFSQLPRLGAVVIATMALLVGSLTSAQQQPPRDMSNEERLESATKYMEEMKASLSGCFGMLSEARESQNIQELNQVNEALSAIKGLMRLTEQNFIMLQEAVAKGNDKGAEHEFVKISIAYHKIMELGARCRAARGPSSGPVDGRPTIDKVVDDDIPIENPTDYMTLIDVASDKPPSASPFY